MTKQQTIQKYFLQKDKLTIKNRAYLRHVKTFTDFFLHEDLGTKGVDVTTKAMVDEHDRTKAKIVAKEPGVIAGLQEVSWLMNRYRIQHKLHTKDGSKVSNKKNVLSILGRRKDILILERTILNILQRMSGIATQTAKLAQKTKGKALLCATRKTQWGLLDKRAVVLGGGGTHRLGLHDSILIKENHLAGNTQEENEVRLEKLKNKFWEIEVENKKELLWAMQFSPPAIMLDNWSPKVIKETLRKYKNTKTIFEVSGNINQKTISQYANTGADIISMGSLTHSTTALDLSLHIA